MVKELIYKIYGCNSNYCTSLQIAGDIEAARNILLDAIERDKVRILTNEMTILCVHLLYRPVVSCIYSC